MKIYLLIATDLLFLLGIFLMRKDRGELKEEFRTVRANNSSLSRQMNFLKSRINSSYVMEVLIWIYVGLLTAIILEYFNVI